MQHAYPDEAKAHADRLQHEINDLTTKAESSSGEEKQGYMDKIQELNMKKDEMLKQYSSLKDKGSGFMGKLGM